MNYCNAKVCFLTGGTGTETAKNYLPFVYVPHERVHKYLFGVATEIGHELYGDRNVIETFTDIGRYLLGRRQLDGVFFGNYDNRVVGTFGYGLLHKGYVFALIGVMVRIYHHVYYVELLACLTEQMFRIGYTRHDDDIVPTAERMAYAFVYGHGSGRNGTGKKERLKRFYIEVFRYYTHVDRLGLRRTFGDYHDVRTVDSALKIAQTAERQQVIFVYGARIVHQHYIDPRRDITVLEAVVEDNHIDFRVGLTYSLHASHTTLAHRHRDIGKFELQ